MVHFSVAKCNGYAIKKRVTWLVTYWHHKVSISLALRKPVNLKLKKYAYPAIDIHCMPIQFIQKLTLIKQRQEIFFQSFHQSTICGIIIIQNRFTISRQSKLEEHKWFYNHLKWCKFCKYPANIYLLKVNKRSTRKRCEIYLRLTIKTLEQHQWRDSGVFIVIFLLYFTPFSSLSIVNFEQANVSWVRSHFY